jgi:hypothetical protein
MASLLVENRRFDSRRIPLQVALDRDEASLALPVVRTDLPDAERLSLLASVLDAQRPATLCGLVDDHEAAGDPSG